MTSPCIVWLRRDLRLSDNPALSAAIASGAPVVCLFVLDDEDAGESATGGASRWWLHHSLAALQEGLAGRGLSLVLKKGRAEQALLALVDRLEAKAVYWNRLYEPWTIARDTEIKTRLTERGIAVESHAADMLREPWEVKTKAGGAFSVFSPFWRALQGTGAPPAPLPGPTAIHAAAPIDSDALHDWALTPHDPDWAAAFPDHWTPGEAGAAARLESFLDGPANGYAKGRDFPAQPAVSRLSPHLHFGEISPRQIWHATETAMADGRVSDTAGWSFLRELGWRDFNRHLLYFNPRTVSANFRSQFDSFPWADDDAAFHAWTRGRTGYPFVDAGMRELWQTGIMHNRVRMVVASFLVKHLLIDWRKGEAWFRDTLVDADLANNVGGWQWAAGCGADAAPYFRIFNPITQGEKFDPDGSYTRHWVPELSGLPDKYLFKPWEAPPLVLRQAGITLGEPYPAPIVDHPAARQRALAAYETVKQKQPAEISKGAA